MDASTEDESTEVIKIPITAKADMLKHLATTVPLNDYGLPEYIYRADFLPLTLDDMNPQEKGDALEAALVELDYSQGFPTLYNGEPFWGRLDSEPAEAYNVFLLFLELPRPTDSTKQYAPVRQVHLLSDTAGMATDELMSLSHLFYWAPRCRAYDLFIAASHNKEKENRLMQIENTHFQKAQHYIDYATKFLDKVFESPDEFNLKPKDAIDLLKLMTSVQRMSVGAAGTAGNNKGNEGQAPAHASLEVTLKTIAANAGETAKAASTGDLTKQLLEDPEMLAKAQELIISLGEAEQGRVKGAVKETAQRLEENTANKSEVMADKEMVLKAAQEKFVENSDETTEAPTDEETVQER